jgi:hypothetical protein
MGGFLKIFLSSTYEDLKEIRNNVYSFFSQFGASIQGMEVWSSSPDEAIEKCLKKVSSCDLYIGIIGQRYGSIDEKTGKSITELEYLEAEKKNIDRLIFIMSDNYLIPAQYVDKNEKAILLNEFKSMLKERHFLSFFSDIKDFSKKIYISFRDYLIEKGIEVDGFNFKLIWEEIEGAWIRNDLPDDIKIQLNNNMDIKTVIKSLEADIESLESFYLYINESYSILIDDLLKILNKFSISNEQLENKIPYYENPFINRDWDMITFFPNRLINLKLHCYSLKLNYLNQRAVNETWSPDLLKQIIQLKEEIKSLVCTTGYID